MEGRAEALTSLVFVKAGGPHPDRLFCLRPCTFDDVLGTRLNENAYGTVLMAEADGRWL